MAWCTLSSLGQHHGMPYQSYGSVEITQSRKGFAQTDINFQCRLILGDVNL